jgi:hypothetical protein
VEEEGTEVLCRFDEGDVGSEARGVEEGSKQARSMKQQRAKGETSETSRGSDVHVKGAIEGFVNDPVQRGSKGAGDCYISKSCIRII